VTVLQFRGRRNADQPFGLGGELRAPDAVGRVQVEHVVDQPERFTCRLDPVQGRQVGFVRSAGEKKEMQRLRRRFRFRERVGVRSAFEVLGAAHHDARLESMRLGDGSPDRPCETRGRGRRRVEHDVSALDVGLDAGVTVLFRDPEEVPHGQHVLAAHVDAPEQCDVGAFQMAASH